MKQHYSWWSYIKSIVQAHPGRIGQNLSGVERREFEAVEAAIGITASMDGGNDRLKVIQMVHFDRTHQIPGAALNVPCSERTAVYWQRQFFETVARNRGLID